jgi:tetratricopeptide (TPR) repeat protein
MLQLSHAMLTDLASTPIAQVLKRLSADGKSGDLQVNAGATIKTVFFDHGRVVFAASNLKKDRLGESLVALGRISSEDFARASALMKDHKRRIGEALVAAGVLDKAELGRSVARQVRRIALSLFELTDGVAVFEERPCPIPLEYMVSLSIHRLLYDGIRQMRAQELILAGLGSLDRRVRVAALPSFPYDPKGCPREEIEIISNAHSPKTLRALAWGAGGLELMRLKAAYALMASGVLIEADASPAEDEPSFQTETGMFLLSALQKRPDPTAREAIRMEVAQELERSANLDRVKWLKLSREAPREQLVTALEGKMEHYHALLDAVGDDEDLRTDIELILGRASSSLRIARQEAKSAPSVPVASVAPLLIPPQAMPLRPSGAAPEVHGARPDVAHTTLEPRAAGPTAGPPSASREPAAPVMASKGASEMAAQQANYLLMEAEVRMTVADYANAVNVYVRLCDLYPEVAPFRAKLAIAMTCYPRTAKQAERQFLEAIRLDPRNAEYHYQLGLYYKAMRLRARAVIEMRAALSLNPRHAGAREELEVLSPKDSALKNLKKLFK